MTGSRDGTCQLWNLFLTRPAEPGEKNHYRKLVQLFGRESEDRKPRYSSPVRCVRFSKKGNKVAVGTQTGEVFIYRFNPDALRLEQQTHVIKPDIPPYLDRVRIVEALKKDPQNHAFIRKLTALAKGALDKGLRDGTPELEKALRTRLFVLSVDFSPDERVLAVGTNIGGFGLYDADDGTFVGNPQTWVPVRPSGGATGGAARRRSKRSARSSTLIPDDWHRASTVRFCGENNRLYVASGNRIHSLDFSGK